MNEFPADITFKTIFINNQDTIVQIERIMEQNGIEAEIYYKTSRNGRYTSYTITSKFKSNDSLNSICREISGLEGFKMIF